MKLFMLALVVVFGLNAMAADVSESQDKTSWVMVDNEMPIKEIGKEVCGNLPLKRVEVGTTADGEKTIRYVCDGAKKDQ